VVQFLSSDTLQLIEEMHAHDADITCLAWAPRLLSWQGREVAVLATSSSDRRVRLWHAP
jgi:hypothetical protein